MINDHDLLSTCFGVFIGKTNVYLVFSALLLCSVSNYNLETVAFTCSILSFNFSKLLS